MTLANLIGEEEIEHKKKKRKVKFEQDESSISEVSRSDAAKEDEPSITTDQEEHNNGLQIGSSRPSSAANLFSRLFSLFASGNNDGLSSNGNGQLLFSSDVPPGYEPFDEDEADQFDDEDLYEFNEDNMGLYQNASVDHLHEFSEQEEFPGVNNNSDSVEGDEDVNDEGVSKSRKRSRDLNSNESESEPKRKRTNNSSGNRIFSSTTKLM